MSSLQQYGTSIGITGGLTVPGENAVAVSKSDVTVLTTTRFLYVGGTGNVAVTMVGTGAAIVFKLVPAGTMLPVRVTKVLSTGTTATNIVAIW